MKKILTVFRRSLVVYILIFLGVNFFIDHERIERGARFKEWHRFFGPQRKDLLRAHAKGSAYVTNCIGYYEALIAAIPEGHYASDVLGYCYYLDGQNEKAIRAYEHMASLKPKVFWYPYNAGVIYLLNAKYNQAEQQLKIARQKTWQDTITYLLEQGAIYGELLKAIRNMDQLEERFRAAKYHTYQLLVLINHQASDWEEMYTFAEEATDQGLEEKGKFSFYAGLAAYKLKRHEEALAHFSTCIEKDFLIPQVNFYRVQLFEALGRQKDADAIRNSAVRYDEGELEIYLKSYPAQAQIF